MRFAIRQSILILSLMLMMQTSLFAQQWSQFVSKEGGFSILMPGQPKQQKQTLQIQGVTLDLTLHVHEGTGGVPAYVASYADLNGPGVPFLDDPRKMLELVRDGFLKGSNTKLRSEKSAVVDRFNGTEIVCDGSDDLFLRARIFIIKMRLFQLVAGTRKQDEAKSASDFDRFFNSFKLSDDFIRPVWKEFRSEDGGFSVMLPGTPRRGKQSTPTPVGPLDVHLFELEVKGDFGAVVSFTDLPVVGDPNTQLDGARDGQIKAVDGKARSMRAISIGVYPGRELVADLPNNRVLKSRIYLVNRRLYQLMTITSRTIEQQVIGDMNRFLDSLKILTK